MIRFVLRSALPLALILLLAPALPARAAELDPVVQEVTRMLEGGVSEPVVASWLETSGRRPARVDSAELVALHKAKASDDLMKRLIRLASGAPAPAAAAPETQPIQPASAAPEPAPPPPAPAAALVPAAAAAGTVPVRFQLAYRPFAAEEDAPSWSLFVYLDGRLLTGSKPAMVSLTTRSWELDRSLPAGHHVIRLVQERHERRFGSDRWQHASRVAPEPLAFDLAAGGSWRVSVQLDQVKISRKGPLTLRVTRGDREVAAVTGGAEPDVWKPLCEDIEANVAGGKPSADARRELARCVRWAALFPGIDGVPSRDEIRTELERDRFQPPAPAR
jgi:hypothetical protein